MKLLGFTISRSRDVAAVEKQLPALSPIPAGGGGWHRILTFVREPFTGAWQRNIEYRTETVLTYSAVFACITLIAADIGKLRIKLVQLVNGIWEEVTADSPFLPVLRKPNRYQTRIKFVEQWITSKLISGNTYVLKERDERGIVTALHVLDPMKTKALQADNGDLYYELGVDLLSGVGAESDDRQRIVVPASEIIHDTMVCLYHPMVGVSPIHASGVAAVQGLNIQNASAKFFENGAQPSGILTAPGHISDASVQRLKAAFEESSTGSNIGRIVALGDGLKYDRMMMTAVDAQMIDQLKLSAETVCSTFHVPPYMIGAQPPPNYNNIQALNMQYYVQCLQSLIESLEISLDEGLGLVRASGRPPYTLGTEMDLDGLLRMDTAAQAEVITKLTGQPILKIDEGRRRLDLNPTKGGDTIYLQQQNYSLEALAERDKMNPLAPQPQAPASPPPNINVNFTGEQRPQAALMAPRSAEEEEISVAADKQFVAWSSSSKLSSLLDDAA